MTRGEPSGAVSAHTAKLVISTLDGRLRPLSPVLQALALGVAKPLIFGSSVPLGLLQMRTRSFSRAELCALAFSCRVGPSLVRLRAAASSTRSGARW